MPSEAGPGAPQNHHLHPATLLFTLGSAAWRLIFPALAVLFFARSGGREEIWLAILFGPAAAAALFRYATLRYRFDAEDLVVRQGLIFRNERHIPYARIQSVDLVQNVLHRLLKVAEVRVQTASGEKAEATFRVLSLAAVEGMRAQVTRARASAALAPAAEDELGGGATPGARRLAAMPPKEIFLYGLISNRGTVVVAAAFGLFWQLSLWTGDQGDVPFDPRKIAAGAAAFVARPGGLLLALAALAAAIVVLRLLSIVYAFVSFHGFTLETIGGSLRTATGLLTRRTATIPPDRIQMLTLRETPLHRLFRRVSVRVATAGGHAGESERTQREDWLVPLVPSVALGPLLAEVVPDVHLDALAWRGVHPKAFRRMAVRRLVISALIFASPLYLLGAAGAWIAVALAVWIVAASRLQARALGWGLGPGFVAFRSGFLSRATSATRFSKIQVVAAVQSPFDRRHGTATVSVDTAGAGGAQHRIRIPFLPDADARALVAALEAGAAASEFRW